MNNSNAPYKRIDFTRNPSPSKLYLYLHPVANDVNYPYFDETVNFISSRESNDYVHIALWLMIAHNPIIDNNKLFSYALKYGHFADFLLYYDKVSEDERKMIKIEISKRGHAKAFIQSMKSANNNFNEDYFYKDLPPEYQLGVIL